MSVLSVALGACGMDAGDDCSLEPQLCASFGSGARSGNAAAGTRGAGAGGSSSATQVGGSNQLAGGGNGGGGAGGSAGDAGGGPGEAPVVNGSLPSLTMTGWLQRDPNAQVNTSGSPTTFNLQSFGATTTSYVIVIVGSTSCGFCKSTAKHLSGFESTYVPTPAGGAAKAMRAKAEVIFTFGNGAAIPAWAAERHANFSVATAGSELMDLAFQTLGSGGFGFPGVMIFNKQTGAMVSHFSGMSGFPGGLDALIAGLP